MALVYQMFVNVPFTPKAWEWISSLLRVCAQGKGITCSKHQLPELSIPPALPSASQLFPRYPTQAHQPFPLRAALWFHQTASKPPPVRQPAARFAWRRTAPTSRKRTGQAPKRPRQSPALAFSAAAKPPNARWPHPARAAELTSDLFPERSLFVFFFEDISLFSTGC